MAYTLVVTSCRRHDLLKQTLDSFLNCADQSPRYTVIIEDGPDSKPEWLSEGKYRELGQLTWLNNDVRMGQAYSVHRVIDELPDTDYVFWCEDDWLFQQQGFVSRSLDILRQHPAIVQVSLRGDDCNGHPLSDDPRFPFKIQEPYWRGGWGGWSFNPGFVRTEDLKSIQKALGPYFVKSGLGCELNLSKQFLDRGYRIAALPRLERATSYSAYVVHIGAGRSRAIEEIDYKPPRLLIAIPACHKLNYGKWESEQSPTFNKATAYNGEAYGTDIHISGDNPRIQAVRETWAKDVAAHSNVDYKFFYGQGATRAPLPDEVFLSVPDDYEHLPHKTIAIVEYARENGYDFVLKCDDDTFIYVNRLVAELMTNRFDYAGYLHNNVCTGGPGYFLSKRAMTAVQSNPDHWAEDVWVAKCMGRANIRPTMLPNHRPGFSAHWYFPNGFEPGKLTKDIVTAHAVQPDVMREWYAYENQTL